MRRVADEGLGTDSMTHVSAVIYGQQNFFFNLPNFPISIVAKVVSLICGRCGFLFYAKSIALILAFSNDRTKLQMRQCE
jgi:hypothetical protein